MSKIAESSATTPVASPSDQQFSVRDKTTQTMGKNYDKYYRPLTEGGVSIYQQQYGGKVLNHDRTEILKVALKIASAKAAKEEFSFTVIDYGAGDGRYFSVMEELRAELQKIDPRFTLKVVAYDPSSGGLALYKKDLEKNGYKVTASHIPLQDMSKRLGSGAEQGSLGYQSDTLSDGSSLTVQFVHGDPGDTVDTTKKLLGRADLSLLMFGVLSHIPRREEPKTEEEKAQWCELFGLKSDAPLGPGRQETLKMHGELLNEGGALILTVPSPQRFKKEQDAFAVLREQDNPFGWARDPNTFYYAKFSKRNSLNSSANVSVEGDTKQEKRIREAYNFYKVYTRAELAEDLAEAGFDPNSVTITIDYIAHIESLLFSEEKAKQSTSYLPTLWGQKRDEWASWAISGVCNWLSGPILVSASSEDGVKTYKPSITYSACLANAVMDWISSYEMAVAYKSTAEQGRS